MRSVLRLLAAPARADTRDGARVPAAAPAATATGLGTAPPLWAVVPSRAAAPGVWLLAWKRGRGAASASRFATGMLYPGVGLETFTRACWLNADESFEDAGSRERGCCKRSWLTVSLPDCPIWSEP